LILRLSVKIGPSDIFWRKGQAASEPSSFLPVIDETDSAIWRRGQAASEPSSTQVLSEFREIDMAEFGRFF